MHQIEGNCRAEGGSICTADRQYISTVYEAYFVTPALFNFWCGQAALVFLGQLDVNSAFYSVIAIGKGVGYKLFIRSRLPLVFGLNLL